MADLVSVYLSKPRNCTEQDRLLPLPGLMISAAPHWLGGQVSLICLCLITSEIMARTGELV